MRRIGKIVDAEQISVFGDYLYAQAIGHTIEPVEAGGDVWIHDDEHRETAKTALNRFLREPEHPDFLSTREVAAERRREAKQEDAAASKNLRGRQQIFGTGGWRGVGLTRLLVVLSVIATVFGGLGSDSRLTQWLSISEYQTRDVGTYYVPALPEVKQGQVWRLLTPVFLHTTLSAGLFGFLHLLFNMLWLRDLGGMLEASQGWFGLLKKILFIGIFSNMLQYIVAGPAFGGMSGVVYGLLGYCWVRGRNDQTSGLHVHNQTMLMMGVWFVACLSGAMGPIANAAHTAGLLAGLAWGWLSAWRLNAAR
ncbi:MAG TPA: hypothetical protein DCS43_15795 [Verrucomicrobia bacterium]|nr:hypothetical protein [Verrucomicrobiota bacterium]